VLAHVKMNIEEKKVPETSTQDDKKKPQQKPSAAKRSTDAPPTASKPIRRRQPTQRVHNPAKVGKADPMRDIPIFLGLVGLLFLIAYSMSGIGGTKEMQKKKSVRQLQDDLRKQFEIAQAREKARKRTMECDLFLATSSVPGTGLGVFAGKRFEIGDEVVSACSVRECFHLYNPYHDLMNSLFLLRMMFIVSPGCLLSCGQPTRYRGEHVSLSVWFSAETSPIPCQSRRGPNVD